MVSDIRLLIIVNSNQRVIVVNSHSGSTVAKVTLNSNPCRVCMFNNIMAAVTLRDTSLQFININDDSIELGRSFSLEGEVCAVARSEDKIVVSFVPHHWLQVLSIDGTVMHTFNTRTAGEDVFKRLSLIAASADGMFYVSDGGTSTITQLGSNLYS